MANKLNGIEAVTDALTAHGMLLTQDKQLPSVVGILTGESLRSSWWSHPQSQAIFSVLSSLAEDSSVVLAKLLNRKDTFIHRQLWPALLAVGRSRDAWQLQGLSAESRKLLTAADQTASVRATGLAAKELQYRLLVTAQQVHVEDGSHQSILESWDVWSQRRNCKALKSSSDGRRELELAARKFGVAMGWLPWHSR